MANTEYNVPQELRGRRFTGRMRQTEAGWWVASCEEVPGALTQGATIEEARDNLQEALMLMLEDLMEEELEELLDRLSERDRGEHLETITI